MQLQEGVQISRTSNLSLLSHLCNNNTQRLRENEQPFYGVSSKIFVLFKNKKEDAPKNSVSSMNNAQTAPISGTCCTQ